MNFLPKEIENIIMNNKEEMERKDKLNKSINSIKKTYLYKYHGEEMDLSFEYDNKKSLKSIYNDFSNEIIDELGYSLYNKLNKKEIDYKLYSKWICLDKNDTQIDYTKTSLYKDYYLEEEMDIVRENMINQFKINTGLKIN